MPCHAAGHCSSQKEVHKPPRGNLYGAGIVPPVVNVPDFQILKAVGKDKAFRRVLTHCPVLQKKYLEIAKKKTHTPKTTRQGCMCVFFHFLFLFYLYILLYIYIGLFLL
jgi:hypothetical protein